MAVICREIIEEMNRLAPPELAESWDNVGLLAGNPQQNIAHVHVALNASQTTVRNAIAAGADMLVTHHPLIFKAISAVRTDTETGAILGEVLSHGMALFAAHTNLDSARGGVNDAFAAKMQIENPVPLVPASRERFLKVAVYVPEDHVESVRNAMAQAGAGHIGNYSHCSFSAPGVGAFLPLDGTHPFIGAAGKLEFVRECRLETIVPEKLLPFVLQAMLAAHPYEEVAYDIYEVSQMNSAAGLGRVGMLSAPMAFPDFTAALKNALQIPHVWVNQAPDAPIQKVAVCGGSGGDFIAAAAAAGAQVYVTADIKYHDAQKASALGLTVMDAGHFATEFPVIEAVAAYLAQRAQFHGWSLKITADAAREEERICL